MTDESFGGSTSLAGYTDGYVYTTGVDLPSGRVMASGSDAILITHVRGYVAGQGAARTVTMKLGSSSVKFTAAAGSSAASTGFKDSSNWLTSASSATFRMDFSGSAYFGRGGSGTTTGAYGSFSGALGGGFRYAKAPTAPTLGTAVQASPVAASLTWSAPSDDGDSTITGYKITYANNPSFTSAQTLDVGKVLTATIQNLTPGATYYFKVGAINAVTSAADTTSVPSATKTVTLVAEIGDLDGWAAYGTLPSGLSPLIGAGLRRGGIYPVTGATGLIREIQATGSGGPVTASTLGIRRTFTGLKIGSNYTLTGSMVSLASATPPGNIYAWFVTGIGQGTGVAVTTSSAPVAMSNYSFTATATTHVVGITLAEAPTWSASGVFESVGFYNLRLWEVPPASQYRLGDTVYEGPLSEHFAWACDTVGAAWWVDRANVTQFIQYRNTDTIKATFTDKRALGKHEFTDVQASYDTRNVVNNITVTNHGRDPLTGDADDTDYASEDPASIAAWGIRKGQMDMTLRSGYVVRRNLLTNPSFEVDVTTGTDTGTGASARTQAAAAGAVNGSWSMRWTAAAGDSNVYHSGVGASGIPITVGTSYTYSVNVRSTVARSAFAAIRFYTAAGAQLTTTSSATSTTSTSAWQTRTVTATAPATAAFASVYVSTTGNAAGNQHYLDAGYFVEGAATTYFDGDTTDTTDLVYGWEGTPGTSISNVRSYALLNQRILEIVADHATPEVTIQSIRWNAQEDPALAASLDVQDRVRVEFNGVTQDSRVIGIGHAISPERWMITLELTPS